jgi:hypothetical protein
LQVLDEAFENRGHDLETPQRRMSEAARRPANRSHGRAVREAREEGRSGFRNVRLVGCIMTRSTGLSRLVRGRRVGKETSEGDM